jgi:ADP-heptose:LPS heptosyltransferase
VLSNNRCVDDIKTAPYPGFTRQPKPSLWQPYAVLFRWAQRLRGQYDVAFIMRFDHWWGALLTYLARVPQRVGYAVPEVAPLLSHAVPYVPGRHEVRQNLRLSSWDLQREDSPPSSNDLPDNASPTHNPLNFNIPERALAWARRALPTAYAIAIHPGAGAVIKLWEVGRWAAVADALAQQKDAQIVLTGSKAERPLCLEIAAQMVTPAQVMAGDTELDQLAALFSRSRLVLGVDSGPLHLAVAVGTPTVHLFGPVDAVAFGPWGPQERHHAIVSAWPCIPCNRLDYGVDELAHHPCVREISVNAVLDAAQRALSV